MIVLQTLRLSLLHLYVRNGMLQTKRWESQSSKLMNFSFRWDTSEFREQDVGHEESDEKSEKGENGSFAIHRRTAASDGHPGQGLDSSCFNTS